MRIVDRIRPALGAALAAAACLAAGGCANPQNNADQTMTHKHHSINYIEFSVLDMAEAQRFYGAAFGWTFQDYGPDYAGLQGSDGAEFGGLSQAPDVPRGGTLAVLYSADLEASLASVKAAGGRVVKEIFEFPGGRRFQFKDPSGNELAVWSE